MEPVQNQEVIKRPVHRFQPGNNMNPGGRPKGLASYIRDITDDGRIVGRFVLDVMQQTGEFEGHRVPLSVRMQAAEWLADRGFGKPIQATEISAGSGAVMIAYMPSLSGETEQADIPALPDEGPNDE